MRRAPFSSNPRVGPRGQRTQQRILDAALRVLRDEGYHRWTVDRIAGRAGCSRVAFYQYFAGREDVLGHLAAQVARQVHASIDGLGLLTADLAGRAALRGWIARQAELQDRYGPVLHALDATTEAFADLAAARSHAGEVAVAGVRSRLATVTLPPRDLDATIALLLGCVLRSLQVTAVLRPPAGGGIPRQRVEDALAVVLHRSLFPAAPGSIASGAGACSPGDPAPRIAFGPATRALIDAVDAEPAGGVPATGTRAALLRAGRTVLATRGYHATRVDDVVAAAGISHGTFYRYFRNKEDIVRALVLRAMRPLSATLAAVPAHQPPARPDAAELRRWLRRYNSSQLHEAAIIRVWMDASEHDALLGAARAPALDWGRRRMAAFLRPKGFGDVEAEAVVMLALLHAFGEQPRSARAVDAAVHVIRHGLLGQ